MKDATKDQVNTGFSNKSILLAYVLPEDYSVVHFLLPFEANPDLFNLLVHANGLLIGCNDDKFPKYVVEWVNSLIDYYYNFTQESSDYRNYLEEFPILNYLVKFSDKELGTLEHPVTADFISVCSFVP